MAAEDDMRRRATSTLVRRNLTLSQDVISGISELRNATESSSDSEVIRRALTTYEQYCDDHQEGVKLRIVRHDGEVLTIESSHLRADGKRANPVKLNMIMHDGSDQRVDTLRSRTGAQSDSEVVLTALRLYEILIGEQRNGGNIELSYPNGDIKVVRFWGVPNRPSNVVADNSEKRVLAF